MKTAQGIGISLRKSVNESAKFAMKNVSGCHDGVDFDTLVRSSGLSSSTTAFGLLR